MAYIGRNKEKRSYNREPKKYYQGYYPKEPSMAFLFQKRLSELIFEIHEFKNLDFDDSKRIEIEKAIQSVGGRSQSIWYLDTPIISRDSKAKREYTTHFKTSLNDDIWIHYTEEHINYWIE